MTRSRRLLLLGFALTLVISLVSGSWAEEAAKVNINTASIEELTQLDGIGANYAKRIVEYREAHGPFGHVEDIMKVQGIGAKTFEVNKDKMTLE